MPLNVDPENCGVMTVGLLRTKFVAIVDGGFVVQFCTCDAALAPTTRRMLSQPRTSPTPVVKVSVTTPARLEAAIRRVIATFESMPLASPDSITMRPAFAPVTRDLIVAAEIAICHRAKRLFTRGQLSK